METKMAYKEIRIMDLREIIRRFQSGQNISQISDSLGRDRKTIRKYLSALAGRGIDPNLADLNSADLIKVLLEITNEVKRAADKQIIFETYKEEIAELINRKTAPLKPKSAYRVILQKHDLKSKSSYSSFKRFINAYNLIEDKLNPTCRT